METLYRKLNTIFGWALFAIASVIYIMTSEPTTSFWDCGEYISTAYKLQVGHPPGAPMWQLLGRFFSLFAFGDTSQVARMINTMSALSSGLTIAFLFWTITIMARKLYRDTREITSDRMIVIFGAGLVGAMAYAFSDSFWFSAVEGEVYAMSSLFTAMTFWAILRWEAVAGQPHSYRWLILIAFLIGVSIGVHLLNLLAIPAITMVFFFKKYPNPNWKGITAALAVSFLLVMLVLYGIVPEVVSLFANTELLFVNSLGLPFNSGTYFFILLLAAFLVTGLLYTHSNDRIYPRIFLPLAAVLVFLFMMESSSAGNFFGRLVVAGGIVWIGYLWRNKKALLNSIFLSLVFILIGYASFFMLVIRSNANPPIDENNPENAISLLAYLNREQYGTFPLTYGQYYNAPVIEREDGKPVYIRDNEKGRYVIGDSRKGTVPVYDPEYMTIFPRMWNNQEDRYIQDYKSWAGITGDPDNKKIPTFSQNLRYFFRYQVNHMYFRYLFWNFVGRQNDNQGMYGDLLNGNWLSGINFLDARRLGPQDDIPGSMANKARNTFFFLPLIFGLIGLYHQFKKDYRNGFVVSLLFFMTGLAIVIYLNQHSPQPRERDYAYAASFYAFAIWIGLSVSWLAGILARKLAPALSAIISTALIFLLVPLIMGAQGWDDHNRSGRYTALEVAKNYLNSCAPNAILFTNGDNDTFPLWYAQEVEGIRTDVRVCNLSLLNTDWYIDQLKRKAYDSDPLPFSLTESQYRNGTRDVTYLVEQDNIKGHVEVKELFDIIHKDEKRLQFSTGRELVDYFPTKNFRITVDSATVVGNGTVPPELAGQVTSLEWRIGRMALTKNYLMMLDLLAHNNWERPVYYVSTSGSDAYLGLEAYFRLEGFAYRLVPIRQETGQDQPGSVNTGVMYDNLMNKFEFNITRPGFLVSDDIFRMTVTLRNAYARLAEALLLEGKPEEALAVADRITEMIPDRVVPYNYFNLGIAEVYLAAGETEKGSAVMERLAGIYEEQLAYFFRFPADKRALLNFDIRQGLAVLNAVGMMAQDYGQEEFSVKTMETLDFYYNLYMGQGFAP